MRIALFHNYYTTPGGEDRMFELEIEALTNLGHDVFPYAIRNEQVLSNSSPFDKARIALNSPFNRSSYEEVSNFLRIHAIDIGHVHNWFPVLSPAVYTAHRDHGIPVVQTLHNYRMGCANGTLRRCGEACTSCLGGNRSHAVLNRCYRNSALGSLAWKRTMDRGWNSGLFEHAVDAYISPSKEVARTHMQMGIPAEKIHSIPNACFDPKGNASIQRQTQDGGALFLGRLVHEKGVDTLIEAWDEIQSPLSIAGSGPHEESFKNQAKQNDRIHFLGQIAHQVVSQKLADTNVLVFPSRWAEPFGLGIIEAMAAGKPVIATSIGAPKDIIMHGTTGLLVPPDNPRALREAIQSLLSNPDRAAEMGRAARRAYEANYRPEVHAGRLVELYRSLLIHSSVVV